MAEGVDQEKVKMEMKKEEQDQVKVEEEEKGDGDVKAKKEEEKTDEAPKKIVVSNPFETCDPNVLSEILANFHIAQDRVIAEELVKREEEPEVERMSYVDDLMKIQQKLLEEVLKAPQKPNPFLGGLATPAQEEERGQGEEQEEERGQGEEQEEERGQGEEQDEERGQGEEQEEEEGQEEELGQGEEQEE